MSPYQSSGLVLAIQPSSHGFGWVLFEGKMVPADYGIASAKGNLNEACMARFEEMLDEFQPSAIILEKFEGEGTRQSERVRILAETMCGFARNRDMDALVYSKGEVNTAVVGNTKATRHAVACATADRLPMLQHRLPEARKIWTCEDERRCLFDAAALGITHYILTHQC